MSLWIERQKQLEAELDRLEQTIRDNQDSVNEVDDLKMQKKQLEETVALSSEQTLRLKSAIREASQMLEKLTRMDDNQNFEER